MRQADKEKQKLNDSLEERLRRRREMNEAKLAKKQEEIESELLNLDIEQVVEQEKAADEAQEMLDQEKQAQAETARATGGLGALGGNGNLMNSILGATNAVNGLLGDIKNNYLDMAKQDEDTRKTDSKKKINKITDEIDIDLEKSKLLNQLSAIDGALAAGIEEDQAKLEEKQAARRALLLARRKNKKKHELEEERVKDKVQLLEEEDKEKEKITEEYIRQLFQKELGAP